MVAVSSEQPVRLARLLGVAIGAHDRGREPGGQLGPAGPVLSFGEVPLYARRLLVQGHWLLGFL